IAHYARVNRGREVVTSDLERAFEEVTGKSMGRFFDQWVRRGGHPEFEVSYDWDGDHKLAKLSVKQTQKPDNLTPIFATPVTIAFTFDAKGKRETRTFTITVENASDTFVFPLDRRPTLVRFDPYGWVLKTLKFDRPVTMLRWQLANDIDPLGRLEAAEGLAKHSDSATQDALVAALTDDSWAVVAAAARSLGKIGSGAACEALARALPATQDPRARRAVVAALGEFHAPERADEARRAATALTTLLSGEEPSYRVLAEAAQSLGRTRTDGVAATLRPLAERPTWHALVEGGALAGLGESATPEAARYLAEVARAPARPMLIRSGAVSALRVLISTGRLDRQGQDYIAIRDALVVALDDPWVRSRIFATVALRALDDPETLPALERTGTSMLESRVQRLAREAALAIRSGKRGEGETRRVRQDVESLREENRKLRDRLTVLETRLGNGHTTNGNGHSKGDVPAESEVNGG
nr:HEAT repeat domain-containing protein [Ktedonobacterales bacterium]